MTHPVIHLSDFIEGIADSPLAPWLERAPWDITGASEAVVHALLEALPLEGYRRQGDIAVHASATVEAGAVLKGPLILGPDCFVAAGAYLRGGNWVERGCIVGPGAELKSSFVFAGSKLAHLNFVGDSILGRDVNLEAGSIVCNYRNERADKEIRVRVGGTLQRTGCRKFGAVLGDGSRIGANAVLAPGALLARASVLRRAALRDDEDAPRSA